MSKLHLAIFPFLLMGFTATCRAQRQLTKEEIYNDWIKFHRTSADCDSALDQLSFDSLLSDHVRTTIRSMRAGGVDTLLVLISSNPGWMNFDTCARQLSPSKVYIFWRANGKDSLKKISYWCRLQEKTTSSRVFDFFSQNRRQLQQEEILPVILGATKQGNETTYRMILRDHETKYELYYSIHAECRRFSFSESDVTNNDGLFYSDNRRSNIYQWIEALEKECR